ncbi:similar to Saccharomyces cerevisiae YHR155W YSP1 Mitochondrial protein with a potential role in promoting mitochondrial fragmentation during programmed cell death in response to high levels of alpha-factor mating pheromone or the drug amiodarone [Maudiozyma barnettii]|uniref:Uncharacterized protein n=1 Tax=Maudiozyma barnettii TaxID=61262 RepID=A0A8H2ZGM6_9SACH|nr:uncharacterized protein KABA2_03S06226 [Kazachstania barnettii]CAB4253823.1 similar to Saccharomyces cerevisiae YHR155W YSP1 Mitochondrial protein with a potential role in promoting mitochondrial fragmentation during programmed cell death in response to high levels of alpha-factor mating pheromone or the drug amiodarone [Kazachstania barnettii]CAD1781572.1 similar to Saccharomyces cerevisiae YHR155W YSP1 Mitochondrial protein with a potential role in promoting mitochondrial fragmentation durin
MVHSVDDEVSRKRQLKLISVSFKEASLDSPSFRASVNFFQTRIEIFEDRLQKTMDFFDHKYRASFEDFQRTKEIMMSQLFPSPVMLSNGMVANQSITPALIADFNKDYKAFSDKLMKIMISEGNTHSVALLDFMTDAMEPYKNSRKTFEYYQSKYDEMTENYLAIKVSNTNLEPNVIKREAIQLFEVRKSYLVASLDLVESMSYLKLSFDKYLADSMAILRTNNMFRFKESGRSIDLCPQVDDYFEDYLCWVENALAAAKTLEPDIHHAKKLIYEYAIHQIQPSQNLDDYNVKSINSVTLTPKIPTTPLKSQEKNGWLFMKTTVGKPPRTIWVRRWCFLQNGVFGMFLLAPSKIYVEETDKFGICLTSTRYDMEEDRKFCFELKVFNGSSTKTNSNTSYKTLSVVLQADSLKELKSWLNAFSLGRKYIDTLEEGTNEHELAFKRFSPRFFEFASSTTTSVDQLITTFDNTTKSLLSNLNGAFSEYENLTLGDDKPYEFHMDITPIATKMSQLAILSNYCSNGSWFPNAILANIWGSTNWTEYALFNNANQDSMNDSGLPKSLTMGSPVKYPHYFTKEMRVTDLQFKSVFFAVNSQSVCKNEQYALFKFNSFWYPNSKQRFSAICYVTVDYVFAYMNTMGFICLVRLDFEKIVSIEIDKSSPNRLIVYNANGLQYKIHVVFDDCRAVAAKLQTLVVNNAEKSIKSQEALLTKFKDIDAEYQEKHVLDNVIKEQKKIDDMLNADLSQAMDKEKQKQLQKETEHGETEMASRLVNNSSFWSMGESAEKILERRKAIQTSYSVMYRHDYDIPSKGLMHILFGDQSNAFPRCLFLAYNNSKMESNTYWNKETSANGDVSLVRKISFQLNTTHNIFNGKMGLKEKNSDHVVSLRQRIVKMVENKYYEVDQEPIFIKLPFCHPLRIKMKIIILEQYDPENHVASKLQMPTAGSMLNLFYKVDYIDSETESIVTKINPLEKLLKHWTITFTATEFMLFRRIIRYYLERIGKHGKIIKTIKLCGLLGITKDSIMEEKESPANGLNFNGKDESHDNITSKFGTVNEKEIADHNMVNYSLFILVRVFIKIIFYRCANLLLLLIRFVFGMVIVTCRAFSNINRILLGILLLSIITNLFLSGRSTVSYWTVKRAERTFQNFAEKNNNNKEATKPTSKAISINDLDILTSNLATELDNPVYLKFNEDISSKDHSFQETRTDLAVRRNQLLVELKILQSMEREVVQGNYREFLLKELDSCNVAKHELPGVFENDTNLQEYCISCSSELERLTQLLL